jgi:hypothetical protein
MMHPTSNLAPCVRALFRRNGLLPRRPPPQAAGARRWSSPETVQAALTGRYLNHETVEAIERLHRTL